jgi:II/X family phage/plasmid replication protein
MLEAWDCTQLDVTLNYVMRSDVEVREALRYLALSEGGRRHVDVIEGTCYWNSRSDLRTGKAYAKGEHLAVSVTKKRARATNDEIVLSHRLLRLELSLLSKFWKRALEPWHAWTVQALEDAHQQYFAQLIGTLEVANMDSLLQELQRVSPTAGLAQAAYRTWLEIRDQGVERVRARMAGSTFRKHTKHLFEAGLTSADLNAACIVPLRRRTIELGPPVHSWEELRLAA